MKSISFKDKFEKQVAESINSNEEVRDAVNNVVSDRFLGKESSDERFDRMMNEIRIAREKSDERWAENNRKWEETQKKLEENDRKWDETQKTLVENDRKWEESTKERAEHNRRWEENQKNINEILASIKIVEINNKELRSLFTETVGSLGTRWGTRSEQSFRNALKGILEEATHYKVLNVIENDTDGVVFGWPAQVELDIVVTNGKLFVIEIKASVSGDEVAIFVKKAKFYEEKHNKKANALVVISPMMDEKANEFIKDRGIIAYSYAS
ncbi:MAG: DUF3782 domain-containing protein, partial [Desulfomonilaceae bacterium]